MSIDKHYVYDHLNIVNKRIYILGLGITGKSALKFFSKFDIDIIAWDDNTKVSLSFKNEFKVKPVEEVDFNIIDFIIISPGISLFFPKSHKIVGKAKAYNIPIYTDIEIFMLLFPNKEYIGITGTNGKSTVVSLLHYVFTQNNINCILAGNIGTPCLDLVDYEFPIVIFELSSYQLEVMSYNDKVKFNTAMFLNCTSDHISYHGSLEKYFKAKSYILKNQVNTDNLIVNKNLFTKLVQIKRISDQKIILISKFENNNNQNINEVYYTNEYVVYFGEQVINYKKIKYLKGEHNAQNISFVFSCAKLYGLSTSSIIQSIINFKGLPHRQEFVLSINGITFINDSKSTTVDSTVQALKTFDKSIFLILGGERKSDNIDNLLPYLQNIKLILLIGSSEDKFADILTNNQITNFIKCNNIENAFNTAYNLIQKLQLKEAIVLLSPACASFDQYNNFMERGDYFKSLVKRLEQNVN